MRVTVVTGAASGIGAAVAQACAASGGQVLGVDLAGAEICADLGTEEGQNSALAEIRSKSEGRIDALIACAGIVRGDPAKVVEVNFFGTTRLATALRPLFAASSAPRTVIVSSEAMILGHDEAIFRACLMDDPVASAEAARAIPPELAYYTSKLALARWVKREAVKPEWAGTGILLNAVAPGIVATPMVQALLESKDGRDYINQTTPMRLGRWAQPAELANFIAFLASPENSFMVGQTVFCDGGAEATLRPEHV